MSEEILSAERERRIREVLIKIPFVKLLRIELGDLKHGEATLHMDAREELMRNNGVFHGGAVASLVDTAAAFAIMTMLEPDQTTTTIDLTIQFLRPIRAGRAHAHARVLRAGRRVVVIAIDVVDSHKVLVATALTSFLRTQKAQ